MSRPPRLDYGSGIVLPELESGREPTGQVGTGGGEWQEPLHVAARSGASDVGETMGERTQARDTPLNLLGRSGVVIKRWSVWGGGAAL